MPRRDPRIDVYIDRSAEFARPILRHFRELVHRGCPEVEETMKWSFPHFDYHGIMCSMAGFKHHCAVGFWKASLIPDPGRYIPKSKEGMGSLGKITSLSDLPPDKVLIAYIRAAAKLNAEGVKVPSRGKSPGRRTLKIPRDLDSALSRNKRAREIFEGFSYTNKRDYVDWITEAKTKETREKRLSIAVEWMAVGRARNWKYAK